MGNENSGLNQDVHFHPANNEVQNKIHNEVQNLPSHKRLIRKVNDELDDDITITYYEDHENNRNKSNDKRIVLVINEKDTSKNIYKSATNMEFSGCYIKDEASKDSVFVNKSKNGCNFAGDVKTSSNFPGELISHNQGSVILPKFDEGNNFAGTDEERTDVCNQDDEWFVEDLHHNPNNINLGMSNGKKLQTQYVHIQALAEEDVHKNQEAFNRDETMEKEHGTKGKYHEENEKKFQTVARILEDIDLQYVERHENKELQERKEEYHLDVHAENERHLDVVQNQNEKDESYAYPKIEYSGKLDSHDHLKTKSAKVSGAAEEIVDKEYGILHEKEYGILDEKPKDNQMEYKEYLHDLDDNMTGKQESKTSDNTDRQCQTKDEESIVEEIGHDTKTENDKNRKIETKVSLAGDIVVKKETKLNKVPCLNIESENPRDEQVYSEVEADHKKGKKHVLFSEKRNYRETEDNINIEEDYIQEANEERNNTKGEECTDAENVVTLPEGYNMRNNELEHCSKHEKSKKFQLKYKERVHYLDDNEEDEQESNTNEDIERECQTKDEKRKVEEIYYPETENNQKRKMKNEILVVEDVAVKRESQLVEVLRLNMESDNPRDAKGHADAETNRKEEEEHILCYEKYVYHSEREDNTNIRADSIQNPNKEKHNIKEEKNADAENEMTLREDISDHNVEHAGVHHVYNNTVDKQESHEDIEKAHQAKDKRNKVEEIRYHTETENNNNMIIKKEVSEKVVVQMENPLEEDLCLSIELDNDTDVKNQSEVETNNKKEGEYLLCYEKKYDKQTESNADNEADSIQETNELKVSINEEGNANMKAGCKLRPEHNLISSEVKHCVEHEKQTDFQMEYKESDHHAGDHREGEMRIQEDDKVCDNEVENCSGDENQIGFQIECKKEDWHHGEVNTNKKQASKINEDNKRESRKEILFNKDAENENNISLNESGRAEIEDHNVDDNMDEKGKSNTNEDTKVECQTKDKKSKVEETGYYAETKNNDNMSIEKETSLTEEVAVKIDNPLEEDPSLNIELENDIDVKIETEILQGKEKLNIEKEHKAKYMECIHAETGTKSPNDIHIPTEKDHITKGENFVESDIMHNEKFVCSNRDTPMVKETENILQNRDIACSTDPEKLGKHKETSNNLAEVQQLNDIAEVIDVAPVSVEPVFFYEVRQSVRTYVRSSLETPQRKEGFLEYNDQVNNKVGNSSESNFPLNEELNVHNENDIQVNMVDNEKSPRREERNHEVVEIKHQIEEENHGLLEIVKNIDTDNLKNEGIEIHSHDINMEEENNRENAKPGQHIEGKPKVHCKEDNQTEEDFHEDIKLDHESDGHLPAQKEHYTKAEIHQDIVLENNRRNEHHTGVKTGFKVKQGDLAEIESQKKDENYIETIANHCSEDGRHVHVEKENHLEDTNHEDNEKGVHIELQKHKDIVAEHEIEEEYVSNKSEKHTKYQDYVDAKLNIILEVEKQEDAAVEQSQDSEQQYFEREYEIKNDEYTHNNIKYQLQNEKHLASEKEHLTKDQTQHGNSLDHSSTGKSMLVEKCFKNGTFSFPLDHEAEEKHISNNNYLKQVQQHGEDLEVFYVNPLYLELIFSYEIKETEDVCVLSNLDMPKEITNEPMLQAEKYQEEFWVNSGKYEDIKIFQPEMLDQINLTVSHAVSNNKSTEEYVTVAEETTASEVTMIHQPQTEKRKGEIKIIIESESTTNGDDEVFIQPNFSRRNLSSINKVSNDDLNMFEGSFNDLTILEELKLMESNLELDLDAEEIAARETLFMSQENIKIYSELESPAVLESDASFVPSQKVNEKTLPDESRSKNPQETPKARQKSKTGRKSPKIRKSPKHQKKFSSDSSLDWSNLSDENDIRKDEDIIPENKQRPRRKISSFRRGRNKHPSNTLQLRFCSCGPLVRCGKAED